MSNKEIANQLTITEGTVKNHVHNALEKLHLTNRVQAAAYAVRQGLREPGGRPGLSGADPAGGDAPGPALPSPVGYSRRPAQVVPGDGLDLRAAEP